MEPVAWNESWLSAFEAVKPYLPWIGGCVIAIWGHLRSAWPWAHTLMVGVLLTASLSILLAQIGGVWSSEAKIQTWSARGGYALEPDQRDGMDFHYAVQGLDREVPLHVLRRRGQRAIVIQATLDVGRLRVPASTEHDPAEFDRLKSMLELYLLQAGLQYTTFPSMPDRIVIQDLLYDDEELSETLFLRRLHTVQMVSKAAWLQLQLNAG